MPKIKVKSVDTCFSNKRPLLFTKNFFGYTYISLFSIFQVKEKEQMDTSEELCINELFPELSVKFIINVSCWICEWKLQVF